MFSYQSIQSYHKALMSGSTTCVEAAHYYLSAIRAKLRLNAFVDIYEEELLERAAALDKKRSSGAPIGKLHGVITGIKDVICYKGHKVTAASRILHKFTATYNATAVQKLLDEEALIIGSLNCDEFAMGSSNENSFYGNVLNALDEGRVPGGSSGGSAVAVQAGLCMVSLGSDTGGSVRQPADFCGIVGLKPTYGRISRYGLIAYASSFDQIGIFANNVPDVAAVLQVISGNDDFDSTASAISPDEYTFDTPSTGTYKIAYFKEALEHPSLDQEIAGTIKSFINNLPTQHFKVRAISFDLLDYIVPAYYVLTTAEASSNLSRFDGVRYGYRTNDDMADLTEFYKDTRSAGFGKEVKRRIMLGNFVLSSGYFDAYFTQAQKVRKQLSDKTALIFNDFDAILLPTVPSTAFKIGEKKDDPIAMYLADIYTVFANLTGIPAISIPLFRHSNGMPFGLQIMTYRFSELSLLSLSHQLMNVSRQDLHQSTNP
ncbi:MAG: Asp-tRNA(Asn)/Glu-tRNA(Gln) amidotransferase subunit GatA [Chitinophagaceae bacterium]|nr:Asp-tRNA(Asn)/Glu-tRNA(Gln) amidotransferase subunit GatA [Chitinophagaceae bacterium]